MFAILQIAKAFSGKPLLFWAYSAENGPSVCLSGKINLNDAK